MNSYSTARCTWDISKSFRHFLSCCKCFAWRRLNSMHLMSVYVPCTRHEKLPGPPAVAPATLGSLHHPSGLWREPCLRPVGVLFVTPPRCTQSHLKDIVEGVAGTTDDLPHMFLIQGTVGHKALVATASEAVVCVLQGFLCIRRFVTRSVPGFEKRQGIASTPGIPCHLRFTV